MNVVMDGRPCKDRHLESCRPSIIDGGGGERKRDREKKNPLCNIIIKVPPFLGVALLFFHFIHRLHLGWVITFAGIMNGISVSIWRHRISKRRTDIVTGMAPYWKLLRRWHLLVTSRRPPSSWRLTRAAWKRSVRRGLVKSSALHPATSSLSSVCITNSNPLVENSFFLLWRKLPLLRSLTENRKSGPTSIERPAQHGKCGCYTTFSADLTNNWVKFFFFFFVRNRRRAF